MRRMLGVGLLLAFAVGLILSPVASAPSSLQAVDSGVAAQFPGSLQFAVSAEGPQPVVDIRLLYQIDKMNYSPVVSEAWASFEPSTSVQATWTWDMRLASLPPGAGITYWWKVRDAGGATVETAPVSINFNDDRFEWRHIESDEVTLFWYIGDEAFAQTLLDVCDEAIETLSADVGASVDRRIVVYIYSSAADLREAMVHAQEWTGGVAFTDYGIVAIGIGPGDMEWGARSLRHELSHLVVHRLIFGPFGYLPTWVDEGLAMHNEGEPASVFVTVLQQAVLNDSLFSLRTLNGPFSSDTQKAYLAYAQSASVVSYLLDTYGAESMHELLMLLARGETADFALTQSYGSGLDDIEAAWRIAVKEQMTDG